MRAGSVDRNNKPPEDSFMNKHGAALTGAALGAAGYAADLVTGGAVLVGAGIGYLGKKAYDYFKGPTAPPARDSAGKPGRKPRTSELVDLSREQPRTTQGPHYRKSATRATSES